MTRLHVQVTLIAATPARLQHGAWHARIMHYPCDKLILSSSQVTRYCTSTASRRPAPLPSRLSPRHILISFDTDVVGISCLCDTLYSSLVKLGLFWRTWLGDTLVECPFHVRVIVVSNPDKIQILSGQKILAHSLLLPPLTWLHPSTLHCPISQNLLHSLPIKLCLINTSLD